MPAIINSNLQSIATQNKLNQSQVSLNQSLTRLSSGMRVNSSKDDAAGMSIATRMTADINGMKVASRNANDAISLAQTAEGALSKVAVNFQRMRELAVQSSNATNGTDDRINLNTEFQQLQAENVRLMDGTKFNGSAILASTAPATMTFQVGSGNDTSPGLTDQITINATTRTAIDTATGSATDVLSDVNSRTAMDNIDAALKEVNTARASYGAVQNRFEAAISNLAVSAENQTAARSRIMDADFASETANLSRAQILQQAGTAMLAQANSLPNGVMALLRG